MPYEQTSVSPAFVRGEATPRWPLFVPNNLLLLIVRLTAPPKREYVNLQDEGVAPGTYRCRLPPLYLANPEPLSPVKTYCVYHG